MAPDANDAWIDAFLDSSTEVEETRAAVSSSARAAARSLGEPGVRRRAQDLVRLAVFTEYDRMPIKRDIIIKNVIGKEASRAFPVILACAQQILRLTFGFELVEMRAKGTENPLLAEQTSLLDERAGSKRRRTDNDNTQSRKTSAASHGYVLRSTLPAEVIQFMTTSGPPVPPSDQSSRDAPHARNDLPMLDWQASEGELGITGLLFVVLGLILVSGRQASDTRIRSCLAQLSLSIDRPLPKALHPLGSGTHEQGSHTLDTFLQQAQRRGYLERVRVASAAETSSQACDWEWRWGARAEIEIGEHAVAAFMVDVYHQDAKPESSDSLTKRIERAAGTPLVG
ncbi:hypothetical protein MGL_2562 [Malassezia globosa CBS 7966]|uniref:MAGE domain-containing protein n=1 Tax=Malassezia globosa (strain ATCC MYA-4612 / CBS 7966) TaxID=425265 RepID=A8Q4L1_MALGO|nr:uncharacterized protein MGL_2562 [Malassezia globosa CBS 7966]EDP42966.1 hypothetical protein MGL_2562 [Malassezia globosa CBS 7966]